MNKYDSWIIRSLGVCVPVMLYLFIDLKTEVQRLDDTKSDKINALTCLSYSTIERVRSEIVAELFCEFGKMINVKEEELEPFRIIAIRKLNRSIITGTTRGPARAK